MRRRAVVVGAGLAGLAAAYRISEGGWDVTVLEAADEPGGRIQGADQDGFRLDLGPTLITDHYTEYLRLLDDLGLSDRLVDSSPLVGIVRGRELHVLDTARPLRAFTATRLLPARAKLALLARGVRLLPALRGLNPYDLGTRTRLDVETMQSYLDRTFTRALNDALLAAVARGVTLGVPRHASVLEFFAGLVAASGRMRNLVGGLDAPIHALTARLDVRTGTPVTAVHRDGARVTVHCGPGRTFAADACVLTPRFADAVELYPPLKESGAALLAATAYTGCYSLQLLYDRRPAVQPFVILVPKSASEHVAAVFGEHVKAPDRAPAGHAQLTVFLNLADTPEVAGWEDERITATAREFVEELFPELVGHATGARLNRWEYAAHQGNVGYYRAVGEFLAGYPATEPVQVAGDYLAVSGQESAVVAATRAARRVLALPT